MLVKAFMVTAFGISQGYWGPTPGRVKAHVAGLLVELDYTRSMGAAFRAMRVRRLPGQDKESASTRVEAIPGTGGLV